MLNERLDSYRAKLEGRRVEAQEAGKVGLALLMWLLGVPGILIFAYLLFGG